MISKFIKNYEFLLEEQNAEYHRRILEMISTNIDEFNRINHTEIELDYNGESVVFVESTTNPHAQWFMLEIDRSILMYHRYNATKKLAAGLQGGMTNWFGLIENWTLDFLKSGDAKSRPTDAEFYKQGLERFVKTYESLVSFGLGTAQDTAVRSSIQTHLDRAKELLVKLEG